MNDDSAPAISIIIPLAAGESLWQQLLPLLHTAAGDEIILAAAEPAPADWHAPPRTRWLDCRKDNNGDDSDSGSRSGRAAQMNAAAAAAQNPYLWFVHADSRPAANALPLLRQALAAKPHALYYFRLTFYDGGWKMRINEIGVRWRCRLFHNPFGDQALCLAASLLQQLGGYDSRAPYGEDHLLALGARRQNIPLICLAAHIGTSARRYQQQGWWKTIFLFQRLWWKQWQQHP